MSGLTARPLNIWPVLGLPRVEAGDDLVALLVEGLEASGLTVADGDVIVVAQKIVSKAEGRHMRLDAVAPTPAARELAARCGKPAELCELILSESTEVMRVRDQLVIVRHRLGHVAANAGIDASNVAEPGGPEEVLLWPVDPDASARALRRGLEARLGGRLAVIVSDSLGRAWRMGTMGSAIGLAGMAAVRDRRGEVDLFGRVLQATLTGVADEIAAAACLVMGEGAEGVPAALVRGAVYVPGDGAATDVLRPGGEDLFR